MAPSFDLPDSPSSVSQSPPREQEYFDEMADLEATYQQSSIRVGDEVDFFASELDRHQIDFEGTPAERRAQVFKLVDTYYEYTRNRADSLYERQAKEKHARGGRWQRGASADMDVDEIDDGSLLISSEELRRVEEEAQTWDLLRRMLPLRYRDSGFSHLPRADDASSQSRSRWWNDFLISDSLARERKVVLEWLQNSASHGPPIDEVVSELQQSAERGDILAHGWLHTRHKIKLQKSVNGYQGVLDPNDAAAAKSHLGSETLITQLDPDAITRQSRKLEPQDEFFERAIWLGCFEMLRRGYTMAEIRDWCSVRTELWRAASLAPLPLSNPEDEGDDGLDPSALVLWRRMCLATARDGGTTEYDKAVYGLLAGDLESVLKVCKSWDDFVFANYNAIIRSQFDTYLVKHAGAEVAKAAQQFPVFNTGLHQTDPTTVGKRLVASLETNEATKEEAMRTAKVLQGAIISKDLDQHMYNQGFMLSKHANSTQKSKLIPETKNSLLLESLNKNKYFDLSDHDSMRLLSHILIIVSTLDRLNGFSRSEGALAGLHAMQEHIIAGYISYLRLASLEEMIPLYCSKLSAPRLYETLSRNLIHLASNEARVHQIAIIRRLGLDLQEFARRQPEIHLSDVAHAPVSGEALSRFKILQNGPATLKYGRIVKPDFFGEDSEHVDPEDELIIRSLEWLLLVDGLFEETCQFTIRAYKHFLKRTKLRAARALAARITGRKIVARKTPLPIREEETDSGPTWFEEFAEGELPEEFWDHCTLDQVHLKTTVHNLWELESLVRALDAIETLSSLAGLTREETNNSREMWSHTSQEVRKAKTSVRPILKGWLSTVVEADPDFVELRTIYIPETILAYISCLHFAGTSLSRDNLLECMDLAAVIADKGSDIATAFIQANRMKELVEAFASCSKALAIWTSDNKKGSQTNPKRFRELGWSRELWSIKP
ncbi:hypothetical protein OQA88_10359 [Cercophora sp. LCS_1]